MCRNIQAVLVADIVEGAPDLDSWTRNALTKIGAALLAEYDSTAQVREPQLQRVHTLPLLRDLYPAPPHRPSTPST